MVIETIAVSIGFGYIAFVCFVVIVCYYIGIQTEKIPPNIRNFEQWCAYIDEARKKYHFNDDSIPAFRLFPYHDDEGNYIDEMVLWRPLGMDDETYEKKILVRIYVLTLLVHFWFYFIMFCVSLFCLEMVYIVKCVLYNIFRLLNTTSKFALLHQGNDLLAFYQLRHVVFLHFLTFVSLIKMKFALYLLYI